MQREPSHYVRETDLRKSGLNFEDLLRMYKVWAKEKDLKPEDTVYEKPVPRCPH